VSGHSVERRYCLSDGHIGTSCFLAASGVVTTGRSRASRTGSGDAPQGVGLGNPAATPSDGSKALADGPRYSHLQDNRRKGGPQSVLVTDDPLDVREISPM